MAGWSSVAMNPDPVPAVTVALVPSVQLLPDVPVTWAISGSDPDSPPLTTTHLPTSPEVALTDDDDRTAVPEVMPRSPNTRPSPFAPYCSRVNCQGPDVADDEPNGDRIAVTCHRSGVPGPPACHWRAGCCGSWPLP